MKTLTKRNVLEQIFHLRERIVQCVNFTDAELAVEYEKTFPQMEDTLPDQKTMLRALLLSATHYLTNVLDLE